MGKFNFRNKKTGEIRELDMSIAEAEAYEKANPNEEWLCGAPAIGDARKVGGLNKPDDGFRDRLKDIKKSHHGSNINTW